jgi:histone deacetylase 11
LLFTIFSAGISRAVELESNCGDEKYLRLLKLNLPESLDTFRPDIVLYNAGTDCLSGDPLGNLDVSREVSCGQVNVLIGFQSDV